MISKRKGICANPRTDARQANQGTCGDTFAGAGFSDQCETFPTVQRQIDSSNNGRAVLTETDLEIANVN